MKTLIIAWAPHSSRSQLLANEFRAGLYLIHYLKFQAPLYAPFKYVPQALKSFSVLLRERPQMILVQNPPIFNALVAFLYGRLSGAQYIIDSHTAAFSPAWRWVLFLHKFLARRAITNIVTDEHWRDLESSWGARSFILENIPTQLPQGEDFPLENDKFSVAVSNTFAPDEPLDLVLEAAAQLPGIHFYITGDKSRKDKAFFANQPDNITFTGFLPEAKYIGLLRAAHAVMALTTRDHTMQQGACEALLLGKPIITSNWGILRRYFSKGTVHVSPTSLDEIRTGILKMQKERGRYEKEVLELREERKREWQGKLRELKRLVNGK